jgi:hypothetical protein
VRERGTHEDDFASGAGAQDDPPRVGFLMFLETKHAYNKQGGGESRSWRNDSETNKRKDVPMPISDHVGAPSRSIVNLNTLAFTVYVVSSSSSPSPSPPRRPGDCVRTSASSSWDPSVAGVSARGATEEGTSACVDPSAGAVVAVTVDVDAAVDADTEADVGAGPKIELGAGAVVCDGVRDGEPNEKPTLPALGGGELSLPLEATPNPNVAGVPDGGPPKVNGDGFAGEPKEVPNMLLTGGSCVLLSFSLSLPLSSADFVVAAPNILPEPAVSPNSFVPGAMEKGDCASAGADEAGLSLSLSLLSGAALSEPNKVEVFGGLPKREVPELSGLPPKGNALEVELVGAGEPNEKVDFNGAVDSASFDTKDLKREEEDVPLVNPDKGDDEAAPASFGSEDVDVAGGKLKGEDLAAGTAGLGEKPVAGAADGAAKPAKLGGGAGMVAGAEIAGLLKENDAAGMEGLVGGVGALCVVA